MPPKNRGGLVQTRKAFHTGVGAGKGKQEEEKIITIESLKLIVFEVESLYSDASLNFSREWDNKLVRDHHIKDVNNAEDVSTLGKLLLKLDVGFCKPNSLRVKDDKDNFGTKSVKSGGNDQSDEEMQSSENDQSNEGEDDDEGRK